jgi:preprotein translocase subunit SecA
MSLYKEWQDLIGNQTESSFRKFWDEYSAAEIKIYKDILSRHKAMSEGSFRELADKYKVSDILFMGFLDGVNSSLTRPMAEKTLAAVTSETELKFRVNPEKLYFNMLQAKADHLYTLPEWDEVLPAEKRTEITKEFRKSQTVVKGPQPGRNDPCPCGSGKKYKKCCGMESKARNV